MNLLCKLGLHDYERVSRVVPTKEDGEFDLLINGYALGRCRRCPKLNMIRCWGGLKPYYPSQAKTKKEWLEILSKEV